MVTPIALVELSEMVESVLASVPGAVFVLVEASADGVALFESVLVGTLEGVLSSLLLDNLVVTSSPVLVKVSEIDAS